MTSLDFSFENLFDPITQSINEILPKIPIAIVILLVGIIIIRIVAWIFRWLLGQFGVPKGLQGIVMSLFNALLFVFLVIVFLQSLGLSNVAFIFSAAVAATGLAIGNGSVTLITDIISGIYLARDRNFSIGDIVRAGEDPQVEGEIIGMDIRRTRIKDSSGHIHSLPNSVVERKAYVLMTKKRDRTDIQPKTAK